MSSACVTCVHQHQYIHVSCHTTPSIILKSKPFNSPYFPKMQIFSFLFPSSSFFFSKYVQWYNSRSNLSKIDENTAWNVNYMCLIWYIQVKQYIIHAIHAIQVNIQHTYTTYRLIYHVLPGSVRNGRIHERTSSPRGNRVC